MEKFLEYIRFVFPKDHGSEGHAEDLENPADPSVRLAWQIVYGLVALTIALGIHAQLSP